MLDASGKRILSGRGPFAPLGSSPLPGPRNPRINSAGKKKGRTMPTSRKRAPKTHHKQRHAETPLSFEDTLKLRNEPDKDLPEAIQRELSTPRIYLHGIPRRRDVDD